MPNSIYTPVMPVSQQVCPRESFQMLIQDYQKDHVTVPSWWNTDFYYSQAIGCNLVRQTLICYKLGITDYSNLVHVCSERYYHQQFEDELGRLDKSVMAWTPFTYDEVHGYSLHQANNLVILNWKEFEGDIYVLECFKGEFNMYRKK